MFKHTVCVCVHPNQMALCKIALVVMLILTLPDRLCQSYIGMYDVRVQFKSFVLLCMALGMIVY